MYIGILLGAHYILHISRIRVNYTITDTLRTHELLRLENYQCHLILGHSKNTLHSLRQMNKKIAGICLPCSVAPDIGGSSVRN